MESVVDRLRNNKPKLTDSTLKTYSSILRNLYDRMDGKGAVIPFFEKNLEKVIPVLKDDQKNVRKTKLAVLVSLFSDKPNLKHMDTVKELMLKDANEYNSNLRNQEKTEKQKNNWMEWEDIKKIYEDLYKRNFPLLKKKALKKSEWMDVLNLTLLSLYVLQAPRRSQDYTLMKIRNYDPEQDNFYNKKNFTFQKYKTSKKYGEQTVKVSPRLNTILKLWYKLNPHDYLLATYGGKPLSVSRVALLLNRIFEKNISTSMIRHVYLSSLYKDVPALKQMDQTATEMGHSTNEAMETYVKK